MGKELSLSAGGAGRLPRHGRGAARLQEAGFKLIIARTSPASAAVITLNADMEAVNAGSATTWPDGVRFEKIYFAPIAGASQPAPQALAAIPVRRAR